MADKSFARDQRKKSGGEGGEAGNDRMTGGGLAVESGITRGAPSGSPRQASPTSTRRRARSRRADSARSRWESAARSVAPRCWTPWPRVSRSRSSLSAGRHRRAADTDDTAADGRHRSRTRADNTCGEERNCPNLRIYVCMHFLFQWERRKEQIKEGKYVDIISSSIRNQVVIL